MISVVIASKDRERYLRDTLASLDAQAGAAQFEVIVVDNGSQDGTRALVESRAGGDPPVWYVGESQPNRARARNRGAAAARGDYLLFCDDDVRLPVGWVAAHAAAQRGGECVVNGPILNVGSPEARPVPRPMNYSRAFLCSCNASVSKRVFLDAGGFDENFNLYGWEDTELGLRLRELGVGWKFAWDAYLWHVKLPKENTLAAESAKAVEKARMARLFVAKHPSLRARLATGAYEPNVLRGRYLLPDWLLAFYAGLATSPRVPDWLSALARRQALDGIYTRELARTIDAAER
ncbi:MAG TPA: glycosyltransferase [Candidatus Binatia bacterium]|nr:glycosyltransferase [Candidatus Binatia bacterium]